jgi:hypothetical protein
MEKGLTEFAQRGYLTYQKPDYAYSVGVAGWYYIQGNTVVRRKIGGRNWSAFCSVESVDSFDLYDAEREKFARGIIAAMAQANRGK